MKAGHAHGDATAICLSGNAGTPDGTSIRPVASPTDSFLVWVVESPDQIWIGGANGTLLNGNCRQGFRQIPGINRRFHLNSATIYEGRLYIACAAYGLHVFDGAALKPVTTGLRPEPEEINQVDAGAGVLWGVGRKDIVHFDGKTWERIDFPFNTPIRE